MISIRFEDEKIKIAISDEEGEKIHLTDDLNNVDAIIAELEKSKRKLISSLEEHSLEMTYLIV